MGFFWRFSLFCYCKVCSIVKLFTIADFSPTCKPGRACPSQFQAFTTKLEGLASISEVYTSLQQVRLKLQRLKGLLHFLKDLLQALLCASCPILWSFSQPTTCTSLWRIAQLCKLHIVKLFTKCTDCTSLWSFSQLCKLHILVKLFTSGEIVNFFTMSRIDSGGPPTHSHPPRLILNQVVRKIQNLPGIFSNQVVAFFENPLGKFLKFKYNIVQIQVKERNNLDTSCRKIYH